jgi:hypothetical protein
MKLEVPSRSVEGVSHIPDKDGNLEKYACFEVTG